MCMWWCIHIFFVAFLPRYSNWDCASSLPWNEIAAWLSLFIAVVIIKMTLIMMIVIEWGWRCDAFVCVATDFPSSVQFYFVAQCHDGFVNCVSSDRLCKSVVFASLVFLLFSLEVISSAFVLPVAAVLIVEAFVFVFCFASWNSSFVLVVVIGLECCCIIALLLLGCFWMKNSVFSSEVMCFDLERAVLAFVLNVGGCFDTWNALLFHQ